MKLLDRGCWTLLAAAALMAAPGAHANAEQAVGLEAQGIDPWAALRSGDLDVRDELGRPVRAAVIVKQLKAANTEAAAQAAYASRLPKANAVIRMLEMISALTAWFAAALPFSGHEILWALAPASRGTQKGLMMTLLACLAAGLAGALRPRRTLLAQPASRRSAEVLRC